MSDPWLCESTIETTPATIEAPPPPSSGPGVAEEKRKEAERRRRARRQANRLATRLAGSLGIHWLLTPAPARAFFELVRKFAKDHEAGREPVFDRPRECLAEDAGVSASAFDQMRRIAVAQGWIKAEVARVQLDNGQWKQEPTRYRPGPLAWRAVAVLLRIEAETDHEANRLAKNYCGRHAQGEISVSGVISCDMARAMKNPPPRESVYSVMILSKTYACRRAYALLLS